MGAIGHSRGIVRYNSSGDGVMLNRPTTVCNFSVSAVNADCIVNLRDGGATGAIIATLEADNAASSAVELYIPPRKFFTNVYAEFVTAGSQSFCSIGVVEK